MGTYKYLISACLCGEHCRYDGGCFDYPHLRKLAEEGVALPYCPEHEGGLPIPRKPCEIVGDKVLAADGTDCTAEYTRGAEGALALCREHGITAAILKESSPSCGSTRIYDGTHTGVKIPGMGLAARLLSENGVTLYSEKALPEGIEE
ncbi:MAG: DUF523 domain-containing protein [Clostridia bacterium]|nr:DUF523 domain-containing protein [Clostridia bacterium]